MRCREIILGTAAAIMLGALTAPASAQELSREQQEVWDFIVACNDNFIAGNQSRILDCFHEDFSGWRYGDQVPRNKRSIEKFLPFDLQDDILAADLRPISIRVFGNFAIAHYFLAEVTESASGEAVRGNMIWTDILLKEGNRWYWVADHGGPID